VFAVALVATTVTGLVDGAPRVSLDTPSLRAWHGSAPVRWQAHRTVIRGRRVHTSLERMGEVLRRALIRLADVLRIASVAAARTIANSFLVAIRVLVNASIRCANAAANLMIILVRGIIAGLESAWWISSNSTMLASRYLINTAIAAGLPTAALFLAAGSTSASAGETLRYLVYGSVVALLRSSALAAVALTALTAAWITLANQPISRSWKSASRSASITAPYGLLLVAIGGWVVGLPGTLGHGRIHVGWVTIASSSLLVAAFVWSQFINKPEDRPEGR
jgi:hypothetical protein